MTENRTLAASFKLDSLTDDGTFSGYGSVFNVRDSFGDTVAPGSFEATLKNDHRPAMLWQHNRDQPIGVYEEIREDKVGLFLKGKFTKGVRQADEAHALLKSGALDGLSIGFQTKHSDFDEEANERTLTEIKLFEVSLVTFPANESARVMDVRGNGMPTERELEKYLRDAGFSRTEAKRVVAEGFHPKDTQRDADVLTTLLADLRGMAGT